MSLKVHEDSGTAMISQVYPFNIPDTQRTVDNAYFEFYDPAVNLNSNPSKAQRNLRWEVPGSSDLTDMKSSYFLLRCKFSRTANGGDYFKDGPTAHDPLPVTSRVSLNSGWSQLLIDRLNVYLNGVNLSEGDHYAYKGWIASILEEEEGWASEPVKVQAYGLADPLPSIGGVAADPNRRNYQEERFLSVMKQGAGEHEGFILDYPGKSENNVLLENPTMRYNQSKYISKGEGFTIMIKPKDSLFLQDDYLIPQIRLKLEMLTSVPNFFCMGEAGAIQPYLSISQARLFLKRIKLTQIAEKSLYQKLAIPGNPAKYIFPRMRYTNQIIGKVPSKRVVSLLSGTRPNKVIVFFTKQLALEPATGSFENNPTAFTEFDDGDNYVKAIYINVAGRQFPT